MNDSLYHAFGHPRWMSTLFDERKTVPHLTAFLDEVYASLDESEMERQAEEALKQSPKVSPYDSHPPLTVRLEYASRFAAPSSMDGTPISQLFDQWVMLNREAA